MLGVFPAGKAEARGGRPRSERVLGGVSGRKLWAGPARTGEPGFSRGGTGAAGGRGYFPAGRSEARRGRLRDERVVGEVPAGRSWAPPSVGLSRIRLAWLGTLAGPGRPGWDYFPAGRAEGPLGRLRGASGCLTTFRPEYPGLPLLLGLRGLDELGGDPGGTGERGWPWDFPAGTSSGSLGRSEGERVLDGASGRKS